MERGASGLTAVFLRYGEGYVGFIEELAGIDAHGRTLAEARVNLQRVAEVVLDEERQRTAALLAGREVLREPFDMPASVEHPA